LVVQLHLPDAARVDQLEVVAGDPAEAHPTRPPRPRPHARARARRVAVVVALTRRLTVTVAVPVSRAGPRTRPAPAPPGVGGPARATIAPVVPPGHGSPRPRRVRPTRAHRGAPGARPHHNRAGARTRGPEGQVEPFRSGLTPQSGRPRPIRSAGG